MRNIKIGGAVIIVILLIGLIYINNNDSSNDGVGDDTGPASMILSNDSSVIRYKIDSTYTNDAFLSFVFNKNSNREWYAQGLMDVNDDGIFSDEEWVVKNIQARVVENFPNRFSFALPKGLKNDEIEHVSIILALTNEPVEFLIDVNKSDMIAVEAKIETVEIVEQFGLNVPGASEELKRGIGIPVAYAQATNKTGIDDSSLPDLTGGPMDCFAIATANNLINMTTQHGRRGDLPEDTTEIIEDLKNAMQWNNGIIGRNFLTGKADYVAAYELPITTEEIKRPSMEDLANAFSNGDAVEVSTSMIRSASGNANTGHVFTGVSSGEGGLSVHDPATPSGTDTLELSMSGGDNPLILVKYPMWDGVVFIDSIYVQHWNETGGSETEESGVHLDEPEEESKISVGGGEIEYKGVGLELSFAHVKPGEYSEVYAVATDLPIRSDITARLYGGGHTGTPQVVEVDENGVAHYTFRISQYDTYKVVIEDIDGNEISSGEVVVN